MKITVRNFGPIREAKSIEVSPMTIFVGPSNTGKSYLAMLIYAIHRSLAKGPYFRSLIFRSRNITKRMEKLDEPQKIATDDIREIFLVFAKAVNETWKEQMVYCFGEEGKKLIEGHQDQQLIVTVHSPWHQTFLNLHSPEESRITTTMCGKIRAQIREDLRQSNATTTEKVPSDFAWLNEDFRPEYLLEYLFTAFTQGFLPQDYFGNAYYLPAIRGGIMQSHLTMVNAVIERAPMVGLTESLTIPMLNGVLSDFLKNLINIGSPRFKARRWGGRQFIRGMGRDAKSKANEQEMRDINAKMETSILSGKIEVEESETQYPDFRYSFAKDGKKMALPLMSASSSVSELAPVSLFIRHYLKPCDLFILEEPEAHLHPGAQRQVSEVLVSLVNAGVNVLVTTHSDNILEQISNYIYADQADIDQTRLLESKCSTYQFKPGPGRKGTKVEKAQFNPETGIVTADHLKVASELYNETVTLMEQSENVGD